MSGNGWPMVPLGELACQRKEFIRINDTCEYVRPRVQLGAKGVVLRDRVSGFSVKTKNQQVCKSGEFLVAEIDAKHGGFGIVPDELDGAIVSSHYFLFRIDEGHINRRFLDYAIRTPAFQEQVSARGSTNYAAIRPQHVLAYTIPLPPRAEQDRIVAKLDALAAKVEEARRLAAGIAEECDALAQSLILSCPDSRPTRMDELVRLREPDVVVQAQESYHFAGVYCFGRGVFRGQVKQGMDFAYDRLTRLREGDFVYPKLMAWEGALATVPPECDGLVVSTEFPVFEVNTARVLPEVLDSYFRTPEVWPALSGSSTGTNVRRRRLKPADFLRYQMPLPPMHVQLKVRAVKARLEAVKAEQAAIAADLNALMPAALDRAFRGEL